MAFPTIPVIIGIVMIFINALLLMISTKIFKLKDTSYKTALKITAILGIVSIILSVIGVYVPLGAAISMGAISFIIVSVLLAMWLIKKNYSLDWSKAALVWLVWLVLSIVVGIIITMIITAILIAVGITAAT